MALWRRLGRISEALVERHGSRGLLFELGSWVCVWRWMGLKRFCFCFFLLCRPCLENFLKCSGGEIFCGIFICFCGFKG